MKWVSVSVEHDGKRIGISASVERHISGEGFHVGQMKFSRDAMEMARYFTLHPTRRENVEADLISKAITEGE